MNNPKQTMTKKEALEAGYTRFIFDGDEVATKIEHISDDDFERHPILIDKDASYLKLNSESIRDFMASHWETEIHPDTFESIDFSPAANLLNDIMSKYPVYYTTEIELTKDPQP